eukprot:CAMPEP_0205914296 /NCGR_PEP_ID=MMETSP1325-20131115/7133_1 /ASSEMBLY_ACC=CAM_ASM_000708 /TAXON_ID=236786 /ORGANISM="Florenciella sp., Strain RCC1007" /LENGTH=122 /DNA_ID=CAMNT_0053281327 /DNA_START=13 /DNA_END=378 /DNA_ORIENTATION=-
MDDYKLSKTKQGVPTYIKVNNHGGSFTVDGTMTLGGDQNRDDSVKLHSYCDMLLEVYEGDFEAAVQSTNPENIEVLADTVCVEKEKVCGEKAMAHFNERRYSGELTGHQQERKAEKRAKKQA